jgi:hypothetical protein
MDLQSGKEIISHAGIALAVILVWLGIYWLGRLREKSLLRNWAEKNRFIFCLSASADFSSRHRSLF